MITEKKSKIKTINPQKTGKPEQNKAISPKPIKTIAKTELITREKSITKKTPLKNITGLGKKVIKNAI